MIAKASWIRSHRIRIAGICLWAVALVVAADALAFRTGLYRSIVEPESYAGQTEMLLKTEIADHAPAQVLVLGDSRIGEGFSARLANRSAAGRFHFVNGAVSGSTPRCWYYLLRDLDPAANKYRAVVLAVDSYDDEDGAWDWADRLLDLRILIFRLRAADVWNFMRSFHGTSEQLEALLGSVLKGTVLKEDVQAFLFHPRERLRKVRTFARSGAEWRYDYTGNSGTLAGLKVDWDRHAIVFPLGVSEAQRREIRSVLFRPTLPQTGAYAKYRREWLGRIVGRYRGSNTRVIIVRLPRGPAPPPPGKTHFSRAIPLWRAPDLVVVDENRFAGLEQPQYFFDLLHLNAAGRALFSRMLADAVDSELR